MKYILTKFYRKINYLDIINKGYKKYQMKMEIHNDSNDSISGNDSQASIGNYKRVQTIGQNLPLKKPSAV